MIIYKKSIMSFRIPQTPQINYQTIESKQLINCMTQNKNIRHK